MMKIEYELTLFGVSEVERITGVKGQTIRDYRRRGYLPTSEGHSHPKYNCIEMTRLWVMKMLADRGVGPQYTGSIAQQCAIVGCWFALRNPYAYAGGPSYLVQALPDIQEEFSDAEITEKTQWFEPAYDGDTVEKYLSGLAHTPFGGRTKWLANEIIVGRQEDAPSRFVAWWPDNSWCPADSLDNLHVRIDANSEKLGFLFSLDLESLGSWLVQRADVPLVRFEALETGES